MSMTFAILKRRVEGRFVVVLFILWWSGGVGAAKKFLRLRYFFSPVKPDWLLIASIGYIFSTFVVGILYWSQSLACWSRDSVSHYQEKKTPDTPCNRVWVSRKTCFSHSDRPKIFFPRSANERSLRVSSAFFISPSLPHECGILSARLFMITRLPILCRISEAEPKFRFSSSVKAPWLLEIGFFFFFRKFSWGCWWRYNQHVAKDVRDASADLWSLAIVNPVEQPH